jgi:hypothetical protein
MLTSERTNSLKVLGRCIIRRTLIMSGTDHVVKGLAFIGTMDKQQRQLRGSAQQILPATLPPLSRGILTTLLSVVTVSPRPPIAATAMASEHRVCQIDNHDGTNEQETVLSSSAAAPALTFDSSPQFVQLRPPFSTRTNSQPPPRLGLQVGGQNDKSGCNLSPLRCKMNPLFAATAMGPSFPSACSSLLQLSPVGLENIDPSGSVTVQWAIPINQRSSVSLLSAAPTCDMNFSDEAGNSKRFSLASMGGNGEDNDDTPMMLLDQRNIASRYQRPDSYGGLQFSGLVTSRMALGAPGYQSFQIWRDLVDRKVAVWEEVQLLNLKVEMVKQAKSLALFARGILHIDHSLQRALADCKMVESSANGNGSLTTVHVATIQDDNQIEDLPSGEGLIRARKLLVQVGNLDNRILCLEVGVQHSSLGAQIKKAGTAGPSESRASLELKKTQWSLENSCQQSGPMLSQEFIDSTKLRKSTVKGAYLMELERVRNRVTTLRNTRRERQARRDRSEKIAAVDHWWCYRNCCHFCTELFLSLVDLLRLSREMKINFLSDSYNTYHSIPSIPDA